jgi:DNA (cytosine-5)-methyltransferase 3A
MSDKDRDIITQSLGVQPVMINAALVSAQNRKRYFWTNIPIKGLPADRGLKVADILESNVDEKYTVKSKYTEKKVANRNNVKQVGHVSNGNGQGNRVYDPSGKSAPLMSSCGGLIQVGHVSNTNSQANRVYDVEGKSATLTALGGGSGGKTGLYKIKLTSVGNVSDKTSQGYIVYDAEGKSAALTARGGGIGTFTGLYKTDTVIRKLTPVECERLMGLPDNYTDGVSMTARYKAVGNAFHVEIMKWIISHIPQEIVPM